MNPQSKALVARAYQKLMGGQRLTREEEMALDEQGLEQVKKTEAEERRLSVLQDPNKSKYLTPAERRYEISKIMGQRSGGSVVGLAGGLNVSAARGGSSRGGSARRQSRPARTMKEAEGLGWNMPASNFSNYA